MKNFKSLLAAGTVAATLLLTSCLGNGESKYTSTFYGVIGIPSTLSILDNVVFFSDSYLPFYSSSFSSFDSGDCVAFYGTTDYTAVSNTYYNVDISQTVTKIPQTYSVYESSTSENNKEANASELVMTGYSALNLVKGKLFLYMAHNTVNSQTKDCVFNMSYDYETETVDGTDNVYTLTLRAYTYDVNLSTGSDYNYTTRAYDINDFLATALSRETSKGNSVVNFRVRYVTGVNNGEVTYSSSTVWQYSNTSSSSSY
jgi:hypothetical protein